MKNSYKADTPDYKYLSNEYYKSELERKRDTNGQVTQSKDS